MIVLSCKNISKSYGIDEILKDVTVSVNEGDKVGIIGANGEGKSTLFKILSKQISYDDGEVFIDKNKTLGYLSQHLDLEFDNTIYNEMLTVFSDLIALENKLSDLEVKMNEPYNEENAEYHNKIFKDYNTFQELYSHRGGYTYKGEISRVLKGLGFLENDFNKEISKLSGGQKTRVALCKLLLRSPEILLLDEPTNHLDLEAIEWLEENLKSYKGTVLIVSHDRFFLDAVTNRTFQVINGHVNCYNAPYTKYLELRKKDYDAQLKAFNLQQAEIKRQEAIIEKFRSFNREKSIKAAESRQKALDKMDKIDAPDAEKDASKISFEANVKSGFDVLHIENLSKSFGEKHLFSNLSLDLKRGEKIALIGENGRGKTTLFKIIMDKIKPDTGVKVLGANVEVGYYDQEQSNLSLNKTILDEPTNHLDIPSREALEEAILSYDGTLIVISHDRYFLNKVIHKIIELEENGASEYLGNYSYYVEKKKNPTRFEAYEDLANGKTKTQIKEEKKKQKNLQKEEKAKLQKIKKTEEDIAKSEENLEKLQESLCLEEVYSNPEESIRVNKEIKDLEAHIEELYATWESLSE